MYKLKNLNLKTNKNHKIVFIMNDGYFTCDAHIAIGNWEVSAELIEEIAKLFKVFYNPVFGIGVEIKENNLFSKAELKSYTFLNFLSPNVKYIDINDSVDKMITYDEPGENRYPIFDESCEIKITKNKFEHGINFSYDFKKRSKLFFESIAYCIEEIN